MWIYGNHGFSGCVNTQTGESILTDTEYYFVVRRKNDKYVVDDLGRRENLFVPAYLKEIFSGCKNETERQWWVNVLLPFADKDERQVIQNVRMDVENERL